MLIIKNIYELLSDYNCQDYVVNFIDIIEREMKTSNFILALDKEDFRASLFSVSVHPKELIKKMWSRVFEVIEAK